MREEDEWAAIARYNKYLSDKRAKERIHNLIRNKRKMYDDLALQIEIKHQAKDSQKYEDQLYHDQVLVNLEKMK